MEKNLKIFQMKSKANYDSLTKNNSCFQKFYSMWALLYRSFLYLSPKHFWLWGQFWLVRSKAFIFDRKMSSS